MSALLREWLLGITCAAMLLALAEQLVPEGGIKRVLRLAGGLLLILMAVNPIVKLDTRELESIVREFDVQVRVADEELEAANDFLYESIIEERTAAYILDKAEKLGITCRVSVFVAWDGEIPKPHAARIYGTWTETQREALSRIMETELGIIPSMQHFEESEG